MPNDKYTSLRDDEDHVSKKDSSKKMPTSNGSNPRPADLGKGQARKAIEGILARRKELDEI